MKTIQEFIDAGILLQSDIDNKYISQVYIDNYNKMLDFELITSYDSSMRYILHDANTYFFNDKDLRDMEDDEFWFRNGHIELQIRVMRQILAERLEDAEAKLEDMINIVNLQEHEDNDSEEVTIASVASTDEVQLP